jgi:L-ascorbate metabolism protein UlaG (beta-lactamase superfamily)
MYNLKRGPDAGKLYHDRGRGNGYEIDFAGTRVYLSGDTECTPEMKALEKIDVAFVCMNLPYTMPPSEAAECIAAFKPRVLVPYHYRGSDLGELDKALSGKGIEIRKREWYPAPK